MNYNKTEQHN